MALPDFPVVCGDDHGIVPANVEHTAPLLINPHAHPAVLLSTAYARLACIRHALEPYAMLPTDGEVALPAPEFLNGFLTALFHQTDEACQIVQASVDRLNVVPDTTTP